MRPICNLEPEETMLHGFKDCMADYAGLEIFKFVDIDPMFLRSDLEDWFRYNLTCAGK